MTCKFTREVGKNSTKLLATHPSRNHLRTGAQTSVFSHNSQHPCQSRRKNHRAILGTGAVLADTHAHMNIRTGVTR